MDASRFSVGPRLFCLLALAVPSAGCSVFSGDGYEVRIATDADEYERSTASVIAIKTENRSDESVYYVCAGEILIERFVDDKLADSHGFGNCDCNCPNPIEAGQAEDRDLPLNEFVVEWLEEHADDGATTYRIRFELYEDTEFEFPLDDEDQRSNAFRFVP